ncbi:MAG: hypothetical protein IT381_20620 [Deltaproteobacteria bacterium]|nr:hypothetical protein [Deltaproteobacteria bacterium]
MKWLALALLALPACTMLIIRAPRTDNPLIQPPDPPPMTTTGPTGPTPPMCPIEASPIRPVAHLYVFGRFDRAATAMAASYEAMITELTTRIAARGVTVTHILLSSYDPSSAPAPARGFQSCAVLPQLGIARVMQAFAAPGPLSGGCELASVAGRLSDLNVLSTVPAALLDGNEPHTPAPFFGAPPTYAIVVLFDHAPRAGAVDACPFDGAPVPEVLGGRALIYPDGELAPDRVFYLAVATAEGDESAAAMAARCVGLEGMPAPLVDVLAPSPTLAFLPFTEQMPAGHARFVDACDALSTAGHEALLEFVVGVHTQMKLPTEPFF